VNYHEGLVKVKGREKREFREIAYLVHDVGLGELLGFVVGLRSFIPNERLGRDVLHLDVVKKVVDKALVTFNASEVEWKERRHYLHAQIKNDIEVERLVVAISAGGDIPVFVAAAVSRDLAEVIAKYIQMRIVIS
jgi:hypothetical protein